MENMWLKIVLKTMSDRIMSLEAMVSYYEDRIKELEGKHE
jgi:hypothetical protein